MLGTPGLLYSYKGDMAQARLRMTRTFRPPVGVKQIVSMYEEDGKVKEGKAKAQARTGGAAAVPPPPPAADHDATTTATGCFTGPGKPRDCSSNAVLGVSLPRFFITRGLLPR